MPHKVVCIWQSEQIDRGRTGSTRESDHQFAAGQKFFLRSSGATRRPLRSLATAGLSLLKIGSAKQCSSASAGAEDCLYRQAFAESCPTGAAAGTLGKTFPQRLGRSDVASLLTAPPEQWVNERASRNCVASPSISLIVTLLKRWRRFIAGWLQTNRRSPRAQSHGT